jgi:hypothetical protein
MIYSIESWTTFSGNLCTPNFMKLIAILRNLTIYVKYIYDDRGCILFQRSFEEDLTIDSR